MARSEKLYKDKNWLYEQYWEKGKSARTMAKIAKCSRVTISEWMKKYDIPLRSIIEAAHLRSQNPAWRDHVTEANRERCADALYRNANWLHEMYLGKGKSTCEIAIIIGCSDSTIWRWMKKLNVPTRSHKDPEYREKYLERWREQNRCLGLKKRNLGEMTRIEAICHTAFEALDLDFIFEKYIYPYRVDFFFPSHGIIVEAMGDYWHSRPKQEKHDTERKAFLEACGYTVLEWWGSDIKADVYSLIDEQLLPLLDQPSRMERPPKGVSKPFRGPHGWKSAVQLYLFGKEQED